MDPILINIPPGFKLESLTEESTKLETEFGTYDLEISEDKEGQITCVQKLVIFAGECSPVSYPVYREFYKKNRKSGSGIVHIGEAESLTHNFPDKFFVFFFISSPFGPPILPLG